MPGRQQRTGVPNRSTVDSCMMAASGLAGHRDLAGAPASDVTYWVGLCPDLPGNPDPVLGWLEEGTVTLHFATPPPPGENGPDSFLVSDPHCPPKQAWSPVRSYRGRIAPATHSRQAFTWAALLPPAGHQKRWAASKAGLRRRNKAWSTNPEHLLAA